jgi:hypothetical protein
MALHTERVAAFAMTFVLRHCLSERTSGGELAVLFLLSRLWHSN